MTVSTHASESAESRNASADAEETPRRRVTPLTLEGSAEDDAGAVLEVGDGARAGGVSARQAKSHASKLLRVEELAHHIPLNGRVGERHFAARRLAGPHHAHTRLRAESPEQGTPDA